MSDHLICWSDILSAHLKIVIFVTGLIFRSENHWINQSFQKCKSKKFHFQNLAAVWYITLHDFTVQDILITLCLYCISKAQDMDTLMNIISSENYL